MYCKIVHGNKIIFSFNKPTMDTGYLIENFNFILKNSYITNGIKSLIKTNNENELNEVIGTIFNTLLIVAGEMPLDYLQRIIINNIEIWCIDDGENICLLRKEEY